MGPEQLFNIFADYVAFKVDRIARALAEQDGLRARVRDDGYRKSVRIHRGDRQADAVDRD